MNRLSKHPQSIEITIIIRIHTHSFYNFKSGSLTPLIALQDRFAKKPTSKATKKNSKHRQSFDVVAKKCSSNDKVAYLQRRASINKS